MIKSLTSLRGIFIIFIFFHHCLHIYNGGGTMAVTFFFVLGGFSMTIGYKDKILKSDFSYRQYLTRRSVKFYPLHWLCLFLALPMTTTMMSFDWIQIPIFFLNAALLQSLVPIDSFYFSYNFVSWYLADTMLFAVLFPFLFKWIYTATLKKRAVIAVSIAVVYTLAIIFLPIDMRHAFLYVNPVFRLVDFIFGIFLALVFFEIKDRKYYILDNKLVSSLVVIMLIALLVIESNMLTDDVALIAAVFFPLVGSLIMVASLSDSLGGVFLNNKYLQCLGDLSFIIFMIHQLVIRYFHLILKIDSLEDVLLFISSTLILTIVLSYIIDIYILKPITQWQKIK